MDAFAFKFKAEALHLILDKTEQISPFSVEMSYFQERRKCTGSALKFPTKSSIANLLLLIFYRMTKFAGKTLKHGFRLFPHIFQVFYNIILKIDYLKDLKQLLIKIDHK